jgi:hypothetical protein
MIDRNVDFVRPLAISMRVSFIVGLNGGARRSAIASRVRLRKYTDLVILLWYAIHISIR